jgi:hypothetical protein
MPAEIDEIKQVYDRIDVWFFQDTSGSCVDYAKRFFAAAASLPQDRFRVRLFCFDTKVYETSLKTGKLYGFGGTCFDIIEDSIQSTCKKEDIPYPEVVFIVTDGYGNNVYPEYPKKWYWFLTEHSSDYCIPNECHKYELKDYE